MTDISSTRQQTLEPSSHGVHPDKLATDLYECSLILFLRLVHLPFDDAALFRRIQTQLQRFRLWGGDHDAREGGLDEKLATSHRLKDILLPVLCSMADALVKIAFQRKQDTELEAVISRVRLLNDIHLKTHDKGRIYGDSAELIHEIASMTDEMTSSGSEVSTIDEDGEIYD